MRMTKAREAEVLATLEAQPDAHVVFPAEMYRVDGRILISRDGVRTFLHRYLYAKLVGPLSPSEFLLAGCKRPRCQNPHHWTVSGRSRPAEPPRQSGAEINASKTTCPHGHDYTPENTYTWVDANGSTHRKCVVCTKARRTAQAIREREARQRRRREASA